MDVPVPGQRADPEGAEPPGRLVLDDRVRLDNLGTVRGRIHAVARQAGLSEEARYRFVFAVNEAMTNALEHGGGSARVRLWQDGQVVCEIRDHGTGVPSPADGRTPARPSPVDERGRGLWLAQHMAESFTIGTGPGGTAVRVAAARPVTRGARRRDVPRPTAS